MLIRAFEVLCKANGVAERALLHLRAEGTADHGQAGKVGGESYRATHVVRVRIRNPLGMADGSKEASRHAGNVGFAREGHDRNTHSKRFTTGRGAVVGKGVEGDIDPMIQRKVLRDGEIVADDLKAIGGAGTGKQVLEFAQRLVS